MSSPARLRGTRQPGRGPTLARAAAPGIARRGTRRLLQLQPLAAYLDDLLAVTAVVLAMAGADAIAVVPLIAIAMLRLSFRGFMELRRVPVNEVGPTGSSVLPRILGVLGLTALFGTEPWGWVATFVVLTILLTEMLLPRIESLAVPYVQNVPGIAVRNAPRLPPSWIFAINVIGVTLFGIAISASSSVAMLSVALVMLLPTLNAASDASLRVLARHRSEPRLSAAIAGYGPTFVLYWDAPSGSEHQVKMWLPYLERLDRPFVIILRNPRTFPEIAPHTTRPIVVRRFVAELDALVVPSLRTAFYVNTSPKNEHLLRFPTINQIQLNHGDSDKAPSYRRVFRAYDKNFVAGQAAIDRFARHGVKVARDAFEIVGRPQVEAISIASGSLTAAGDKRVLYAPTWFGYLNDSRYSSLPIGSEIVTALINRGCTVIFRPHPWCRNEPGQARDVNRIIDLLNRDSAAGSRRHITGREAEVRLSLVDCFNTADALIADVSSVVSDFLYSEKPFAVVQRQTELTYEDFLKEFPLARAAYVLRADSLNLDSLLDDLLIHDPQEKARVRLKTYYLGDFPAATYADGFVNAARRYV